jgi:20S proteasome alpha/beta subunit
MCDILGGAVTIALGILADNAVVLAADTQVGTEYLKMDQAKISWARKSAESGQQLGALGITGSGGTAYLEHLQRDFTGFFLAQHGAPLSGEVEKYAQDRIKGFYTDHVIPFSTGNDRPPDVWIVLAYCDGLSARLWSTERNVVTEHQTFTAVGIGEMHAKTLLGRLFLPMWPMSIRTAVLLAGYVISQVKDSVEGCGKETDILCLQPDAVHVLDRRKVKAMDDLFGECSRIESELVHQVFGGNEGPASISRQVRRLKSEANRLLSPTEARQFPGLTKT